MKLNFKTWDNCLSWTKICQFITRISSFVLDFFNIIKYFPRIFPLESSLFLFPELLVCCFRSLEFTILFSFFSGHFSASLLSVTHRTIFCFYSIITTTGEVLKYQGQYMSTLLVAWPNSPCPMNKVELFCNGKICPVITRGRNSGKFCKDQNISSI